MARSLHLLRHVYIPNSSRSCQFLLPVVASRVNLKPREKLNVPINTKRSSMLASMDPNIGFISSRYIHTETLNENAYSDVLCTVENGVRKITFNRPEKKNALKFDMFQFLMKSLHESNDDENTTIIVITGTGDYFTSGMDMSGPFWKKSSNSQNAESKDQSKSKMSPEAVPKSGSKILPFVNAFLACKKPIIALVNGPTLGIGVTMLGLVDGVYACERAFFQAKFTQFGLPPDVASTYTFPKIMGYARANRILMNCEKISAKEAYEFGLVSRIFSNENFDKETKRLLQEYGSLPVKSLMYSKRLVKEREIDVIRAACEEEQKCFDPEVARNVKQRFLSMKT